MWLYQLAYHCTTGTVNDLTRRYHTCTVHCFWVQEDTNSRTSDTDEQGLSVNLDCQKPSQFSVQFSYHSTHLDQFLTQCLLCTTGTSDHSFSSLLPWSEDWNVGFSMLCALCCPWVQMLSLWDTSQCCAETLDSPLPRHQSPTFLPHQSWWSVLNIWPSVLSSPLTFFSWYCQQYFANYWTLSHQEASRFCHFSQRTAKAWLWSNTQCLVESLHRRHTWFH